MACVLGDPALRERLQDDARARLSEMAPAVGNATNLVAQFMRSAKKPLTQRTYVWQQLSAGDERDAQSADATAPYYNYPRVELINLIRMPPKCVLDVGCGGGATGLEIKRRFPGAVVHGIELSGAPAKIAASRLDRVLNDNVEKLDFTAAGFAAGSIDLVLFPDVLEHLYDPWGLLQRLRPYLAADAHVLASIPNVRNLWLINELLAGKWDYVPAGLLDVTHIRFFTRKTIGELFAQTGYRIETLGANIDARVPDAQLPGRGPFDITTDRAVLRGLTAEDFSDLRTIQFLVDATPSSL